jgi:uncharacterized protein YjbI with pentapeptide repeats
MKYDGTNLAAILAAHKAWLYSELNGERADLRGADLSGADLRGADLSSADLSGADLRGADLRGADLSSADLSGADLRGADLRGAYLSSAYLIGADLSSADLSGADLSGAYLRGADLSGADLSSADLSELQKARLSILPDTGEFTGWKQCQNRVIVRLRIPADAKRSNATGRKCRAEFADVLEVIGAGVGLSKNPRGNGLVIEYRVGQRVRADSWDKIRWNECSHGIHFYLTRIEAEND